MREPDERLLDLRELAEWLNLSEHTVRKYAAKGPASGLLPPGLRIGGVWRFRPESVRAWLVNKEAG